MLETVGNIWDYRDRGIIAITTNGSITRDNRAILGRGVARQAAARFPCLAENLGRLIASQGNHVFYLGKGLVSFPVEETAWSLPDLQIIANSARDLVSLTDAAGWQFIVIPRPGCGGGGLLWRDVKPVLEYTLDNRFQLICAPYAS